MFYTDSCEPPGFTVGFVFFLGFQHVYLFHKPTLGFLLYAMLILLVCSLLLDFFLCRIYFGKGNYNFGIDSYDPRILLFVDLLQLSSRSIFMPRV